MSELAALPLHVKKLAQIKAVDERICDHNIRL